MRNHKQPTLLEDCISRGLEICHHESDLYIEDLPKSRALLSEHNRRGKRVYEVDGWNVSVFYDDDGKRWLEVPFANHKLKGNEMIIYFSPHTGEIKTSTGKVLTPEQAKEAWCDMRVTDSNIAFQRFATEFNFSVGKTLAFYKFAD